MHGKLYHLTLIATLLPNLANFSSHFLSVICCFLSPFLFYEHCLLLMATNITFHPGSSLEPSFFCHPCKCQHSICQAPSPVRSEQIYWSRKESLFGLRDSVLAEKSVQIYSRLTSMNDPCCLVNNCMCAGATSSSSSQIHISPGWR